MSKSPKKHPGVLNLNKNPYSFRSNNSEKQIDSISIGLASPVRIRKWTERILPNGKKIGEVLNSKTLNYKTLKPEIGGLFCEKIFGPTEDFKCLCGFTKRKNKTQNKFCVNCDVEFTTARVRRYRLGYIKLASPVSHIWYLRGRPRFLNILFDRAISLGKGKNKEKIKDLKPTIYGIDGIYISILRLIKTNREKSDEIISQEKKLKSDYTFFKYNFLEKKNLNFPAEQVFLRDLSKNENFSLQSFTRLLWYETPNYNTKTDIHKDLQSFLKKRYFIKKLKTNLFVSLNKEYPLFKKQFSKIFCNSCYYQYNIYSCDTIIKFNLNLDDKKVDENKNVVYFRNKQKRINIFLYQTKIFLNKKVLKTENLTFFTEKKLNCALQNKANLKNQIPSNFHLIRSKFLKPKFTKPSFKIMFSSSNENEEENNKNAFTDLFSIENENNEFFQPKVITQTPFFKKPEKFSFPLLFKLENKFNNLNKSNNASLPFSQKLLKENLSLPKNLNTNLQSQIDSYYPVSSRCVFKFRKGEENKKLEFKFLWNSFVKYMTSDFVKQDITLQLYSDRLANRYTIRNGFEYKYTKVVLTGTEAISYWLKTFNLEVFESILKKRLKNLDDKIKRHRNRPNLYKFQQKTLKNIIKYRRKVYRVIKLVYYLKKNKLRPDWLMISILPVLPPNLRPIIELESNQMAVSDLNQLYKRVVYRNTRIEKYFNTNRETDSHEIRFHQRLLQEAVDSLLDNGKGGSPLACSPNGRPFKSLAEILKGKKGRFRQNLLGKRVDYSGRSVIVVGPELKLHECGLPKEMAIELFQPFIIRDLINLSPDTTHAKMTIVTAKQLIKTEHPIVWRILQKILKNHPILLNRAPTLHRLGIQAFQPKLVKGRAILLHPLVCPAFNADFDGDQMAVHVPLCFQARAEAWKLMWSRNNLLSPATGEPIMVPSQDMVLGCYYLTTINTNSVNILYLKQKTEYNTFSESGKIKVKSSLNFSEKHKPFVKFDLVHNKSNLLRFKKADNSQKFDSSQTALNFRIKSQTFNLFDILTWQNKNYTKKQFKQDGFIDIVLLSKYFYGLDDVLVAFSQNKIFLHSLIWVKWEDSVEIENFNERPIEIRIDCYGNQHKIYSKYCQHLNNKNMKISQFILTTVGRIIFNKVILKNTLF